MKKKAVKLMSILLAAALLVCASVGGTLAYLSAKSETVVNTFTVGNINIKLEETKGDGDADLLNNSYKMIPGGPIPKDPKVTIESGSEDCWLFVKIEEGDGEKNLIAKGDGTAETYITYSVATGWTAVPNETDVYYRKTNDDHTEIGTAYSILSGDQVLVKDTVTKAMMEKAEDVAKLSLKFTAYAVQLTNVDDVEEAWYVATHDGAPQP